MPALDTPSAHLKKGVVARSADGVNKAVVKTNVAFSRVNSMAAFGLQIGGMMGVLASAPLVGKLFKKAENVAAKPDEVLKKTTVRDAARFGETALTKATEFSKARLGEETFLTKGLGRAAEKAGPALGSVKRAAENVTDNLATRISSQPKITQKLGGMADKLSGSADGHLGKAKDAFDTVMQSASGRDEVAAALSPVKSAIGSEKLDAGGLSKAVEEAQKAMSEMDLDGKTRKSLTKGLAKVSESAAMATQRQGAAEKLSNLPDAIRKAPDSLANASLKNVALKGTTVTATALVATSTAKGVSDRVHALKMMYMDLTGESKISTRKLLMSKKLPDAVKAARGNIMKEFGPRVLLNLADIAASYVFVKNNSTKGMLYSFGLKGASTLHAAQVQNLGLLPVYEALSQKAEIPPEEYAMFISMASKNARQAGGVENELVQALAIDYAEAGARPADILKDVESGKFDERATQKVADFKAAAGTVTDNADKLRPQALGGDKREVVGEHTQRLQQQTLAQQAAANQPPAQGR